MTRVLVTGATGYVGSRLVPELLGLGHEVVAGAHTPASVADYAWADEVEVRELDIHDADSVAAAVEGIEAVVYLVHSMDSGDFVRKDREAAERMAAACQASATGRIVYLSGLVPPDDDLSDHLRSRLEVEKVLLASGTPTTVLRAAMVIGAGSTSYELLSRLSERVPWVTPVPRWMRSRLQPVSIEDVVHVIGRALQGEPRNRHYDLGGDEVLTYPELLAAFAGTAGLRRLRLVVPGLPRSVVGRACALIAGMPIATVTALVDSLEHEMVCQDHDVRADLCEPDYEFTALGEALRRSHDPSAGEATGSGDVQSSASTDPA